MKFHPHTHFLNKEGKAAGLQYCPGYLSRLSGIRVKARRFHFLKKEGIAAGLASWLDICPSRNCIKAAHSNFLNKDGNRAATHSAGQSKHRSGNPIEAAHFFFLGLGGLGRLMMAAMTVASALMTLPITLGSSFIEVRKTHVSVSNVSAEGGAA